MPLCRFRRTAILPVVSMLYVSFPLSGPLLMFSVPIFNSPLPRRIASPRHARTIPVSLLLRSRRRLPTVTPMNRPPRVRLRAVLQVLQVRRAPRVAAVVAVVAILQTVTPALPSRTPALLCSQPFGVFWVLLLWAVLLFSSPFFSV